MRRILLPFGDAESVDTDWPVLRINGERSETWRGVAGGSIGRREGVDASDVIRSLIPADPISPV